MRKLFTSESVTCGHPDKVCDLISDSILDEYLKQDPNSRVACETVASKDEIYITGEISSNAKVDIESVVRNVLKNIGYDNSSLDIDYRTCNIRINISSQSQDIALGVDNSYEEKQGDIKSQGAGDQGMMFGFACDESENYMPYPIYLAHKLAKRLEDVRKQNIISGLRPDGKTQVTIEYENDKPLFVDTIVISTQHEEEKDISKLRNEIKTHVIDYIVDKKMINENTKIYINPTGRFVIGRPKGDSGLTGRKIIVDTYGGYSRHGGGAFSGKDATKVDRSGAYIARHIAKNIVANGMAKKCEILISYAIGVAKPVSIFIETFGTAKYDIDLIEKYVRDNFDLTPDGIINYLDLTKPIFTKTTNYGHFGKDDLPWEKIVQKTI